MINVLYLIVTAVHWLYQAGINEGEKNKNRIHSQKCMPLPSFTRYHCENAARVKKRFMVSNLYQFFIFVCACYVSVKWPSAERIVFGYDLFTF